MAIDLARLDPAVLAGIQDLTSLDIGRLRLGFWSRLSEAEARDIVERFPGRSVWLPDTLEYAIVAPWRHRDEVSHVIAMAAVRHPAEVLEAAVQRCERLGTLVVIFIELDDVRRPAFYDRAGFQLLEEVITYDFDCRDHRPDAIGRLDFRVADIGNPADLDLLLRIDHDSFPWLWWNGEAEFRAYASAPGVEILIGAHGTEPIAYLGLSAYLGWAHLDRIAVVPTHQGQGFGGEALRFAVDRLARIGAKRIGLSTQKNNRGSRRLYERFGFKRATEHDYRLYGRILRTPDGIENLVNEG